MPSSSVASDDAAPVERPDPADGGRDEAGRGELADADEDNDGAPPRELACPPLAGERRSGAAAAESAAGPRAVERSPEADRSPDVAADAPPQGPPPPAPAAGGPAARPPRPRRPDGARPVAAHVVIVFYSLYGHAAAMAEALAAGCRLVPRVRASIYQVEELVAPAVLHEWGAADSRAELDRKYPVLRREEAQRVLAGADAVVVGCGTRFGGVPFQMKSFLDSLGSMWVRNLLVGKLGSAFTGTATQHGGQESTLLSIMAHMMHLGLVYVGCPYSCAQISADELSGGGPYGAAWIAGRDGTRALSENERLIGRFQGRHVAQLAADLVAGRAARGADHLVASDTDDLSDAYTVSDDDLPAAVESRPMLDDGTGAGPGARARFPLSAGSVPAAKAEALSPSHASARATEPSPDSSPRTVVSSGAEMLTMRLSVSDPQTVLPRTETVLQTAVPNSVRSGPSDLAARNHSVDELVALASAMSLASMPVKNAVQLEDRELLSLLASGHFPMPADHSDDPESLTLPLIEERRERRESRHRKHSDSTPRNLEKVAKRRSRKKRDNSSSTRDMDSISGSSVGADVKKKKKRTSKRE